MAVDSFRHSVERDPAKAIYHYHLGLAYAKAGEPAKARLAFQQALKVEPDFSRAYEVRQTLSSLER
jgi:Flp pilus assembly protein TadD